MGVSRIFRNIPKGPFMALSILIFANIELYRIQSGKHPYWTPNAEAAGIVRSSNKTLTEPTDTRTVQKDVEAGGEARAGAITWTNLNGVPIPTLGSLMRPFGKD